MDPREHALASFAGKNVRPSPLPLLVVCALGVLGASPPAPPPERFLAGVSFAMTNDRARGYDSERAGQSLSALSAQGVTAVSIMPFAFQREPAAARLTYRLTHAASETDGQVRAAIRAARTRGLTVLVKPHVWVPRSWPGAIEPPTEEAFRSWWDDYRTFLLEKARLAADEHADILCVGTELSRIQRRPEWRALIPDVRRVFPGALVYAANWDATDVPFADLLDFCGVDLYEPLSSDPEAGDAALMAGARRVVARLDALAKRTGKPVLLTEAGFAARRACWVRPNEESGPLDVDAQSRATRALLSALEASQGVRGLFWWKVFSDGEPAGPADGSFRVTGRPAERELFTFFARRLAVKSTRTAIPLPRTAETGRRINK